MRFPDVMKMCMPAQAAAGAVVLTWLMAFAALRTPRGNDGKVFVESLIPPGARIVLTVAGAVGSVAYLGIMTVAMNALCKQGYGMLASAWAAYVLFGAFSMASVYATRSVMPEDASLKATTSLMREGRLKRAEFENQLRRSSQEGLQSVYLA